MKSRHRAHGRPTASLFGRRVPVIGPRDIVVKLADWATDPTFAVLSVLVVYFVAILYVGPNQAP